MQQQRIGLASPVGGPEVYAWEKKKPRVQRLPSKTNLMLPELAKEKIDIKREKPEIKILIQRDNINYFTSPKKSRRNSKYSYSPHHEPPSPLSPTSLDLRKRIVKGRPAPSPGIEGNNLSKILAKEGNVELGGSICSYRLQESEQRNISL